MLLGQFVSQIGTIMQNFAFSLYVLKTTGSGKAFASVLAVQIIPQIFIAPFSGVLADWFDRKKIIVLLDMLSGALIGGLYLISITVGLQLIHIYIAVALLTIISTLFYPAIGSMMPAVMKKEELMDANALNSVAMSSVNILGPILAGFVFGFYGIETVLLLNSISFICSAISEMFINAPKLEKKNEMLGIKQFKEDFIEGIVFLKDNYILLLITITAFMMNFIFNPLFSVGLTYISKITLGISDIQYGMLESIAMVGAILAPIFASIISKRLKLSNIFMYGIFVCVLLLGFMSLDIMPAFTDLFNNNIVPFTILALTCALFTLVLTISNLALMTLQQKIVPLDILGRYYAVSGAITMGAVPLGQMMFGTLFDKLPSYVVVLIGFSISLIFILVIAKPFIKVEERSESSEFEVINAEI